MVVEVEVVLDLDLEELIEKQQQLEREAHTISQLITKDLFIEQGLTIKHHLTELHQEHLQERLITKKRHTSGRSLERPLTRRLTRRPIERPIERPTPDNSAVEDLMEFCTVITYQQTTITLVDIIPHFMPKFTITVMDITSIMVNTVTTLLLKTQFLLYEVEEVLLPLVELPSAVVSLLSLFGAQSLENAKVLMMIMENHLEVKKKKKL